jgi:hypothetical protein
MNIGEYVEYKTGLFIVCEVIADKAHILSPIHGKRFVNLTNLTKTTKRPAEVFMYGNAEYIVTALGAIISCKTNKLMKWKANSPVRKAIYESLRAQVPKHLRLQAI